MSKNVWTDKLWGNGDRTGREHSDNDRGSDHSRGGKSVKYETLLVIIMQTIAYKFYK